MGKHPYFPPGVFIDTEMMYTHAPSCTTTLQKIDKETLLADFQKAIDVVVAAEATSARYPITVPVPRWFYDKYREDFLKDTEYIKYVPLPEKFGDDV